MFYDQKLENILKLLERQPYWTSKALAENLGISRSTVQRCLEDLHRSGLALRIHGGVRRNNPSLQLPLPLDERSRTDIPAKQAICQEAGKLIGAEGYVYLDAGTTVLPLARQLSKTQFPQVHFVTNDLTIALTLSEREMNHTLLGGRVHPVTQTISGPVSQSQVGDLHFDTCFISATGIDPDYGVTCSLNDEAHLKRLVMKQSTRKVLLAASGKWGQHSGSRISRLEDFDLFITEQANLKIRKICKIKGLGLITASDHHL
jgi:DeoR/GlpR family transcriptional regulator of sugar metabolism